MTFLNPAYLWSLLALAVPVAIHLWSKKEGRVIRVGSVEFLGESDTKQSSSIKLNEIWLLILRCLIIGLLAIILAGPALKSEREIHPVVFLVEKDLVDEPYLQEILDTLVGHEQVKYLAEGFPAIDADISALSDGTPNYWQLARQMESLQTDSIVVFTRARLSGLKGVKPTTSKNISWVTMEPDPEKMIVEAAFIDEKIRVVQAEGAKDYLKFERRSIPMDSLQSLLVSDEEGAAKVRLAPDDPWIMADTVEERQILIVYEEALNDEMEFIRASFNAIQRYLHYPLKVEVRQVGKAGAENPDLLVWLTEKPMSKPAVLNVLYKPDSLANSIIVEAAEKGTYYLTQSLDVETVVSKHLTEHLLRVLNIYPDARKYVEKVDVRVADVEALEPVKVEKAQMNKYGFEDISGWLWLLLVAAATGERMLALYRKQ